MKKIILATLLIFTSCAKKDTLTELNLTYVKSPLNIPAILNYKNNIFADSVKPITINYHEINSGAQQTEAMAAQSVDIATVLGGTSAILAAAANIDIKIISMFSRAPKAFQMMAKDPSITNISGLRGKKIGGPKGTVLHQLLLTVLQSENMTTNDIEFISMGISEALTSVLSGNIDIALLGGPATLQGQKQGLHLVTTGEGFVDGSTVVAVHNNLLTKHPELVQKYIDSQHSSIDLLNSDINSSLAIVAPEVGLSIEEVKQMMGDYDFTPTITETDIQNLEKTQDFLFNSGLLTNKITISDIIYTP